MRQRLQTIKVDELELGMYLQSLDSAWIDSPFWRTRFRIDDEATLQTLRSLGGRCVIDLDQGAAPRGLPAQAAGEAGDGGRAEAAVVEENDPELRRLARMRAQAGSEAKRVFEEARLGHTINREQCRRLVDDIAMATASNPDAALALLRLKDKDEYTHLHSVAVCALMINLATQTGLPAEQIQLAGMVGLLHDIGKVAIPLPVLNKPGALTDEEFTVVKNHPMVSYELIIGSEGMLEDIALGCLYHHEKYNGTGYPKRLAGPIIPLLARMCALCDVYDAITSNRPYKDGWDPAESVGKMLSWRGHFDPQLMAQFVRSVGIYPVGALVRLQSSRLAVVIGQNRSNLTKPRVQVIYDVSSASFLDEEVDLAKATDYIAAPEQRGNWPMLAADARWLPYVSETTEQ